MVTKMLAVCGPVTSTVQVLRPASVTYGSDTTFVGKAMTGTVIYRSMIRDAASYHWR